jgi:flagellar biosynthesis/type III secretory pathway M-ring protein FliF/YscJ
MFSTELRRLLIQVISSWQVIAVTVIVVIYILIVNRVARLRSRSRPARQPSPKKTKSKASKPPPEAALEASPGSDELGLEEENQDS